jgi:hypothetical protein
MRNIQINPCGVPHPNSSTGYCYSNVGWWVAHRSSVHTRHLLEITKFTTHMSPLWGFRGVRWLIFYKHIAPLGLWVGQDAQPTGVVHFDTHIALLEL